MRNKCDRRMKAALVVEGFRNLKMVKSLGWNIE
jgi:hypothetical protein